MFISCSTSRQTVKDDEFTEKGGAAVEATQTNTNLDDYKGQITAADTELVREMCNCSWDIIRLNRDTKRFHKNNDKTGLLNLKPKIAPAYAKFETCMADLKRRKGEKIASTNPQIMMAAMEKDCPELVDIMEFSEPLKSN